MLLYVYVPGAEFAQVAQCLAFLEHAHDISNTDITSLETLIQLKHVISDMGVRTLTSYEELGLPHNAKVVAVIRKTLLRLDKLGDVLLTYIKLLYFNRCAIGESLNRVCQQFELFRKAQETRDVALLDSCIFGSSDGLDGTPKLVEESKDALCMATRTSATAHWMKRETITTLTLFISTFPHGYGKSMQAAFQPDFTALMQKPGKPSLHKYTEMMAIFYSLQVRDPALVEQLRNFENFTQAEQMAMLLERGTLQRYKSVLSGLSNRDPLEEQPTDLVQNVQNSICALPLLNSGNKFEVPDYEPGVDGQVLRAQFWDKIELVKRACREKEEKQQVEREKRARKREEERQRREEERDAQAKREAEAREASAQVREAEKKAYTTFATQIETHPITKTVRAAIDGVLTKAREADNKREADKERVRALNRDAGRRAMRAADDASKRRKEAAAELAEEKKEKRERQEEAARREAARLADAEAAAHKAEWKAKRMADRRKQAKLELEARRKMEQERLDREREREEAAAAERAASKERELQARADALAAHNEKVKSMKQAKKERKAAKKAQAVEEMRARFNCAPPKPLTEPDPKSHKDPYPEPVMCSVMGTGKSLTAHLLKDLLPPGLLDAPKGKQKELATLPKEPPAELRRAVHAADQKERTEHLKREKEALSMLLNKPSCEEVEQKLMTSKPAPITVPPPSPPSSSTAPINECGVCLEPFDSGEHIEHVLTGCGHVLCGSCLVGVKIEGSCPFCRTGIIGSVRVFRG